MKKNAMLKIAAILMVAVLLTTCAISSTFAKYVTTDSAAAATGRVAKFGYTIDTSIKTEAFADKYATDDRTYNAENSVISLSGAVLAPGTEGSLVYSANLEATGESEVAVKAICNAAFAVTGFTDAYFPVVFTVGEGEDAVVYKHKCLAGGTYETTTELIEDLNEALSFEKDLAANTAKETAETLFADVTVAWAWAFNNTAADPDTLDVDAADTALGDAGSATIAFTVSQSITQID